MLQVLNPGLDPAVCGVTRAPCAQAPLGLLSPGNHTHRDHIPCRDVRGAESASRARGDTCSKAEHRFHCGWLLWGFPCAIRGPACPSGPQAAPGPSVTSRVSRAEPC